MKAFCVQIIDLHLFSDILRDVAMATNFVKNGKLPTFVALALRNGMGYRCLNVRINSVHDASISCENFVNLTELICERLVRHAKNSVFC